MLWCGCKWLIVTDIDTLDCRIEIHKSNILHVTSWNAVCRACRSEICVAMVTVAVSRLPHKRCVFRGWWAISAFWLRDRGDSGAVSRAASLCPRHSAIRRLCVHQRPGLTLPHCKSLVWPPADCHNLWWRWQWRLITCDSSIFIRRSLQQRQLHVAAHVEQKNCTKLFF